MTQLDSYILLFNDSLVTSLMFVPRLSYAFDVMRILGRYDLYLMIILHFTACLIGAIINWIIGFFFRKIENYPRFSYRKNSLLNAEKIFAQYGKWILFLSSIPFWGALFTTAAGVLRFNFIHFLLLVAISRILSIGFIVFFN